MYMSAASESDSRAALPQEGTLRVDGPPFCHAWSGMEPITTPFLLATAIVLAAGVVLFGTGSLAILAIAVATSMLIGVAFDLVAHRGRPWSNRHALLTGCLLAATLPPTVGWEVVVVGAACAVLAQQALIGGIGNHLWHPVAIGRVAVQVLFHHQLTPEAWPVLAPGRLLWGSLSTAVQMPAMGTWGAEPLPVGVQAWLVHRPIDLLRAPLTAQPGSSQADALAHLIRDTLPPWSDTLFGLAGGAIGGACVLAVIIAGLLLAWQGFLRGRMVVTALVTVAVLAAILPVRVYPNGEQIWSAWWPGAAVYRGLPVGLVYVCYQMTAGEFLLVLMVLAPDPSSSPLTARGHAVFGLLLAAGTMVLRCLVGIPAAAYWALLIVNTLVPLIDRLTRRRVWGTRPTPWPVKTAPSRETKT
jgi:Na+-translocating ferredoxin:NAD+ oxidoreductase subunit D